MRDKEGIKHLAKVTQLEVRSDLLFSRLIIRAASQDKGQTNLGEQLLCSKSHSVWHTQLTVLTVEVPARLGVMTPIPF